MLVEFESRSRRSDFNDRQNVLLHDAVEVDACQFLSLTEPQLITVLVFAEVVLLFLDRPVRQVHCCVLINVERELVAAHPNVALFKQVPPVLRSNQHPQTDVELSLVDEHWPLDVFLDHDRFGPARCLNLRGLFRNSILRLIIQAGNQFFELIDRVEETNTAASIPVIRFENPDVLATVPGLTQLQLSVGWLSLLLEIRVRQKCLIDLSHLLGFVLLDRIEKVAELVKLSILGRLF